MSMKKIMLISSISVIGVTAAVATVSCGKTREQEAKELTEEIVKLTTESIAAASVNDTDKLNKINKRIEEINKRLQELAFK